MTENNGLNKVNTKKLSDIANILNGYAFKSANYVENGIRVIRIANVQDGCIVDDAPCFYPVDTNEDIKKYNLFAGDFLISLTGNVGRIGILPADMLPAALNQRVCCLRIDETIVDRKYLFYYFRRHQFMRDCVKASKGVAQLNLSIKWLAEYEVPIPSIAVQKSIVARIEELFSELDNGVETLQKTKQQLAVYRQAVLKQAFDTNDTETIEISELVDDIRIGPFGTMLHKSDYVSGGVPVINPQHIKSNVIIPGSNVTISVAKAEELNSYKLRCNDIVMGRRGEMGRCAAVTEKEDGWICGTGSIMFKLKADFDAVFYAQILSSPDVVHYLEENATGTTMKNLNEEIVKHIPVPYITRQQQTIISQKIDAALSVCDSIEKTVDTALHQAEAMRQSILKQAFEGKL